MQCCIVVAVNRRALGNVALSLEVTYLDESVEARWETARNGEEAGVSALSFEITDRAEMSIRVKQIGAIVVRLRVEPH